MTVFSTNSATSVGSSLQGAARVAADLFHGLAAGYGAYLAYTRLDRMSDRQLAEMGLTRSDVPRAAASGILNR